MCQACLKVLSWIAFLNSPALRKGKASEILLDACVKTWEEGVCVDIVFMGEGHIYSGLGIIESLASRVYIYCLHFCCDHNITGISN